MTLTDREFVIRANAREQLFEVLGTDFFKGADVTTIDEIEIPPLTTLDIPISLNNGTLPHDELPIDAYRYLSVSTRSRYAQIGAVVLGSAGIRVSESIDERRSIALVPVCNFAARPILLSRGTRLFRFYAWDQKTLQGEDLIHITNANPNDVNSVSIQGEFGRDWFWEMRDPNSQKVEDIVGIRIKVGTERSWLNGEIRTPVQISDLNPNFRQEIDGYLEPIIECDKSILWIGEHVSLGLGLGIEAVLMRAVFPDPSTWEETNMGIHMPSLLIDSGFTKPVRVEIFSPTTKEDMPNYVSYFFVKNGRYSA